MQLKVPKWDIRSQDGLQVSVIDEDTGRSVGSISHGKNEGRFISLFDGRYKAAFKSYEECVAFVKGVETVLNYMVSPVAVQNN